MAWSAARHEASYQHNLLTHNAPGAYPSAALQSHNENLRNGYQCRTADFGQVMKQLKFLRPYFEVSPLTLFRSPCQEKWTLPMSQLDFTLSWVKLDQISHLNHVAFRLAIVTKISATASNADMLEVLLYQLRDHQNQ